MREGPFLLQLNTKRKRKKAQIELLTASSLLRELSLTRTLNWPLLNHLQITCSTSGAYHVQRVCNMVRRDSSAIKSDILEIAFILALFHWVKPLTNEGGGGIGLARRKPLTMSFTKCHTLNLENSSLSRDSNVSIGGRCSLGKQTCFNHYTKRSCRVPSRSVHLPPSTIASWCVQTLLCRTERKSCIETIQNDFSSAKFQLLQIVRPSSSLMRHKKNVLIFDWHLNLL